MREVMIDGRVASVIRNAASSDVGVVASVVKNDEAPFGARKLQTTRNCR